MNIFYSAESLRSRPMDKLNHTGKSYRKYD